MKYQPKKNDSKRQDDCVNTYQLKQLKEINICIQGIFHSLQAFLGQGTHGLVHRRETSSAAKDNKAVQEHLTASNVLQSQVRDTVGELQPEIMVHILLWNSILLRNKRFIKSGHLDIRPS